MTTFQKENYSSLIGRAMELNNQGVQQAIEGNHKEAVSFLKRAYEIAVVATLRRSSEDEDQELSSCVLHQSKIRLPVQQSCHGEKDDFRCNEMFTLAPYETICEDEESLSASDCRVLCSVILFHTGILYHRQAVSLMKETPTKGQNHVAKAEKFYERAIRIASTNSEERRGTGVMVILAGMKHLSLLRLEILGDDYHVRMAVAEGFQMYAELVQKSSEEEFQEILHRAVSSAQVTAVAAVAA